MTTSSCTCSLHNIGQFLLKFIFPEYQNEFSLNRSINKCYHVTYFELFSFAQWSDFASKCICSPFLIQYYTANFSLVPTVLITYWGALSAFGYLTYLFRRESQLGLSRFDIDLFLLYVSLKAVGFIELQG